jgi:FKBP-type peptidyl-prolyl cis-trans isomerase SlyD
MWLAIIALALGLALGAAEAQAPEPAPAEAQTVTEAKPAETANPTVQDGAKVQVQYTLTDEAGTVIESNTEEAPLTYTQGSRQIIPGLENALDGMRAGEEKQVTVQPADAYGDVNPAAMTEVPREQLPPDSLQVGMYLIAEGDSGRRIVRVKEIKEETVILDLNHPLAGKTLHFDVKVMSVELPGK